MAQYTELRYFHLPPKLAQQTSLQVININNLISELQLLINTKVDKLYNRQLSLKNFTIVDKNTISKSLNQIVDLLNLIDSLPDIVLSDWNTLDVDDMSYIKNKPNVPILDLSGLIPASYLPSYVDDVLEYPSFHDLPQPGEPGKIYVTTDNDLTYRWSGITYVEISKSIITGVKGDAETNYRIGNVNLTAANIGLGNVVNLDLSKAIKGITRNGLTFTYTCLDGTTGTFDQQDNNTTYSAGTGLLLTNTAFSVKLGYTTSGNNRAVQADANGNLYVTLKDDNTWTAWKGATASADGTAGYMPAPTKAQYLLFLRGDGTWVSLNNYSLPLAANGTRGGILIGYTQSGKNYPVLLSSEKAYVNVPWTDTTYSAGTGLSLTDTTFALALTKKLVTDALGYTPPTTDTNTHRPIWVNGTEILGNNTTVLNLKAGSNVTLTNSSGTVTIASTWRGIQNNLTSDSTTDSLSAALGKVLNTKFANYLPLSGGTLSNTDGSMLTINRIGGPYSWITFNIDNAYYGNVGIKKADDDLYFQNASNSITKVWHAGNDGSGSGLDADTVDGIHANNFHRFSFNSIFNKSDYQRIVILFVKLAGLKESTNDTAEGNICYTRPNGIKPKLEAHIVINDSYSLDRGFVASFITNGMNSETAITSGEGYRLCRCMYNGEWWGGFEFYILPNGKITWHGSSNRTPVVVAYYNMLNDSIINSEIYNSLDFSTANYELIDYYILATKLKNARKIWGRTFDGTGNIAGDIYINDGTNASNESSSKIRFDTNLNLTYSGPYIQALHQTSYGRKRLSVFLRNAGDYTTEPVEVFTILPNGNVGINTAAPSSKLHVNGGLTVSAPSSPSRLMLASGGSTNNNVIDFTEDVNGETRNFQILDKYSASLSTENRFLIFHVEGSGSAISIQKGATPTIGIGGKTDLYTGGAGVLYVYGAASATAWNTHSDIRSKDIKEDANISVETIANAPLFYFYWKNKQDEDKHVGTSAQYWLKVLPEVITGNDKVRLHMDYSVAALTSAITVAREVVKLDKKIKLLEEENKQLKEELLLLKSQINDILTTINKSTNNE